MGSLYAIVLGAIVLSLLGVSISRLGKVKTKADYLVAGRSLPAFVLIFTLLSSWIGSGSLLGGAENAYKHGFVALWQAGGGWAGAAADLFHRAARAALCAVHDSRSAGDALQPDGESAGGDRDAVCVHGDHELSADRRRRHSAPGVSGRDLGRSRQVHHGGVRDRVYRDCRHGVGGVYGCGDRDAGGGDACAWRCRC